MDAVPPTHRGLRPAEAAALCLLALIWGASFLFIKVALEDLEPLAVVAGRLVLGTAGIGGYLLVRRGWAGTWALVDGVSLRDATVLAVTAAAVPFLLISWAETEIPSSLAGVLNAALPLTTALLALRVDPAGRIRGWRNIGLAVGFAGVALVAGAELSGSVAGVGAMLGAVVAYAAGAHYAKRRFSGVEPVGVALAQTTVSTAIVLPLALLLARPTHVPSAEAAGSLLALGLAGTALAWVLYYWLVASAGPQQAVAVTYLAPIAALAYGAVLLGERITTPMLAGTAVIIAGQLLTAAPARRVRVVDLAAPALVPAATDRPGAPSAAGNLSTHGG